MAFELSITETSGNTVDGAYWAPCQINMGMADKEIKIVFCGYLSAEARAQGMSPLQGAVREYVISGPKFDQLLKDNPQVYAALARVVYGIALATKDVRDSPVVDETGQQKVDGDGQPMWNMRSFFGKATNT